VPNIEASGAGDAVGGCSGDSFRPGTEFVSKPGTVEEATSGTVDAAVATLVDDDVEPLPARFSKCNVERLFFT
jgi:hypothetical protein